MAFLLRISSGSRAPPGNRLKSSLRLADPMLGHPERMAAIGPGCAETRGKRISPKNIDFGEVDASLRRLSPTVAFWGHDT